MKPNKFETAIALIDKANSEDPNLYEVVGLAYPKELLYSKRMTRRLLQFQPHASVELQLAARAQHICRWKIPREQYAMDRVGYLKWREKLKKMHADLTEEILVTVGFESTIIERVKFIIQKKLIKKDKESQALEDTICLVFLEYYLEEFAEKHQDDKVIDILQKTWIKMSGKAHEEALEIRHSNKIATLLRKAIA